MSTKQKFVEPRPYADPEVAARKLIELAHAFEPVHDGRIYIEKINWPFLFELKGTPAEYKAGLDHAIAKGWLVMHESGTSMYGQRICGAGFPSGKTCVRGWGHGHHRAVLDAPSSHRRLSTCARPEVAIRCARAKAWSHCHGTDRLRA
jgi:hypothetical protein